MDRLVINLLMSLLSVRWFVSTNLMADERRTYCLLFHLVRIKFWWTSDTTTSAILLMMILSYFKSSLLSTERRLMLWALSMLLHLDLIHSSCQRKVSWILHLKWFLQSVFLSCDVCRLSIPRTEPNVPWSVYCFETVGNEFYKVFYYTPRNKIYFLHFDKISVSINRT